MPELPFVSVIVLNWNGQRHLHMLLQSLEAQSYPRDHYDIVFVDNASSDDSVAFVRQEFPKVKIEIFEKNYGFAEGNNRAAIRAQGKLLAFLNNDTEADQQWLAALVQAYQQHPGAILGSQAYQFEARDISANSLTKLTPWGVPMNVNVFQKKEVLSKDIQETFYADAAGMLVSKDLFLELEGFDQTYFAYEEEKDLSWKAWLRGHPSYLVPASIYYHKGGATLGQNSPRATYLLWRNGLRNMIKYLSGPRLLTSLLLHICYSLVSFLLFFLPKRQWSLAWSQLRAYFSVGLSLPKLIKQRRVVQKNRVTSDRSFVERGLALPLWASIHHLRRFITLRRRFLALGKNNPR